MVFWIFGGKGWFSWSVNYKGDCRTAWVWHDNWGIVNILQKLIFLAGFGTLLQYLLAAWREEERRGQEEARYFQHLSKLVLRPEIRWYGNWTRRRLCTGPGPCLTRRRSLTGIRRQTADSDFCNGSAGLNYSDVTLVSEDERFFDGEVSGFLPGTGTVQQQVQLQLFLR